MITKVNAEVNNSPFPISGGIFKNIDHLEYILESDMEVKLSKITFPYVLVISKNLNNEKFEFNSDVTSTIVVPLYNLEHFLEGRHLEKMNIKKKNIKEKCSNESIKCFLANHFERYHCLSFETGIPIIDSVIDFKHAFTVKRDYLIEKNENKVCNIVYPHREQIIQRFSNYISKIENNIQ